MQGIAFGQISKRLNVILGLKFACHQLAISDKIQIDIRQNISEIKNSLSYSTPNTCTFENRRTSTFENLCLNIEFNNNLKPNPHFSIEKC